MVSLRLVAEVLAVAEKVEKESGCRSRGLKAFIRRHLLTVDPGPGGVSVLV